MANNLLYCCKQFKDTVHENIISYDKDYNNWLIKTDTKPIYKIINYCPFCGIKLK